MRPRPHGAARPGSPAGLQVRGSRADHPGRTTRGGRVGRNRTDAEQQIADLLQTARRSLRLSVAFLSRLDGTTQHLEVVETSVPFLFQEGYQQRQEVTLCQAILDRKLPAVIPNLADF